METIKIVLDSCKEFIFFDHYNIERIKEFNHVRDCIFDVLSKHDVILEIKIIGVLGVIYDISLMVIDGNFEDLVQEKNNLWVGLMQLFCLEKL